MNISPSNLFQIMLSAIDFIKKFRLRLATVSINELSRLGMGLSLMLGCVGSRVQSHLRGATSENRQ